MRPTTQQQKILKTSLQLFIIAAVLSSTMISFSGCGKKDNAPKESATVEKAKDPNAPSDSGLGKDKAEPTEEEKAKAHTAYEEGVALSSSGQWKQAVEKLNEAVTYDPLHVAARTSLGWAYSELAQWDSAVLHLHEAIKLDPNNAAAHGNLAWAYAETEKYHLAVQEAKKATELDPNNAYAYGTMGWGYSALGESELAKEAYEKAIAIKPTMSSAHAALGSIFCERGDTRSAKEHLKKMPADSAEAIKLLSQIKAGCG